MLAGGREGSSDIGHPHRGSARAGYSVYGPYYGRMTFCRNGSVHREMSYACGGRDDNA